ncbi:MAG: epimerase [Chloroflexi bacterium]|nr:epimerase [Chloroflexota bacterium]
MKLLILGGTVFLGRHLVDAALARGHEVTLFNRGEHNPELFPAVEKLRGNRDGDLASLQGRRWDAVVDTCGYVPRVVGLSARLLAPAVDHYTFISTLSVYSDTSRPGIDETGPLGRLEDETVEEVTGETYGPLKVLCERAAEEAMPGRTLAVRPGLIVGPFDPTDRFTYWPHRVAQGGEVLAPDGPEYRIQIIDARDLAEWTIHMVEARGTGVYNAVGPSYGLGEPLTLGRLLDACNAAGGGDAAITWVAGPFLIERGVTPWMDLPVWFGDDDDRRGFASFDCGKAVAAGLTFRPLAETVRATLDWDATRPPDHTWRAGLSREREAELLRAWHERA